MREREREREIRKLKKRIEDVQIYVIYIYLLRQKQNFSNKINSLVQLLFIKSLYYINKNISYIICICVSDAHACV